MTDYLVDTNHVSKILEGEKNLKFRLRKAKGDRGYLWYLRYHFRGALLCCLCQPTQERESS